MDNENNEKRIHHMANKPINEGTNSANQSQKTAKNRKNIPRGSERPWGESPKES